MMRGLAQVETVNGATTIYVAILRTANSRLRRRQRAIQHWNLCPRQRVLNAMNVGGDAHDFIPDIQDR